MVYYRKYRPQNISELDLSDVRDRLTAILSAKELPHAFLFTGPKGLGKTSSARILAKAINCENKNGVEPCNKCEACLSITNGSNMDVIEIDAASNRGIDEIRDLREKIKFAPSSLPKKVYIIDEVHMLTTDAFNALLKTLEEPPAHAVFILCTTEEEKVPPTIMSRTFHVKFRKPTREELVNSLERIVKGEKLEVESGVLDEVFKLSEGAFRDGAKILEDLSLSANGKITKDTIEKNYKSGSISSDVTTLLKSLASKNMQESLQVIERLADSGTDFKTFTERLAEVLHAAILARANIGDKENDISEFKDESQINDLLTRVNESYKNIKFSVLPQIPLELVVVGFCLENKSLGSVTKPIPTIEVPREVLKVEVKEEVKAEIKSEPIVEEKKVEKAPEVVKEPATNKHGEIFNENSKSQNFMAAFLAALKRDNHSIAGILRGCKLVEITPEKVVFETKYKFHRDKLSEGKVRETLSSRASEILKDNVAVVVNLV